MEKLFKTYGIGNALVDIEFDVDDQTLRELNIEKGLMTLVDEDMIYKINSLANISSGHKSCGGSAGNTMIALAQLGAKSFYSCKVADDENGRFFLSEILRTGLETNLSKRLYEGETGQCLVFVTPDAERTMNTHLGITESFSEEEIDWEALKKSELLYVEGYLVTSNSGRSAATKALDFAKKNGLQTVLTFSDPSMPTYFRDGLIEMIGGNKLDLLFCNRDELLAFTKESDEKVALENILDYTKQVVMTSGADGALYFSGDNMVKVEAPKVTPIDTVGAGDCFAGAFIYANTMDNSIEKSLKFSCACASKVVTKYGSRLTGQEINKIKEDVLGN